MARTAMVSINLRVTPEEADAAEEAAHAAAMSLSGWMRQALLEKIKRSQS